MDLEFGVDVFDMGIDGMVADDELVGDALFCPAVEHEFEDILFAFGEVIVAAGCVCFGEHFEDSACDAGIDGRAAVG